MSVGSHDDHIRAHTGELACDLRRGRGIALRKTECVVNEEIAQIIENFRLLFEQGDLGGDIDGEPGIVLAHRLDGVGHQVAQHLPQLIGIACPPPETSIDASQKASARASGSGSASPPA